MPNWCNNYAEIHGPKATIKALHDAIINEGKFFGHMRPEPNYEEVDVYPTFPGIKGNNDPVEKSQSWWDWRVQNWGTKWELGDEMKSIFTYEEVNDEYAKLSGVFDTAWSPACDAFQYFADNNEGVQATVYYYEPGMGFCGVYDTDGGDDYYDISGMNSERVKDEIPEALDECMGISECMAEYEAMERDELEEWYEDGVEKTGLAPHKVNE